MCAKHYSAPPWREEGTTEIQCSCGRRRYEIEVNWCGSCGDAICRDCYTHCHDCQTPICVNCKGKEWRNVCITCENIIKKEFKVADAFDEDVYLTVDGEDYKISNKDGAELVAIHLSDTNRNGIKRLDIKGLGLLRVRMVTRYQSVVDDRWKNFFHCSQIMIIE